MTQIVLRLRVDCLALGFDAGLFVRVRVYFVCDLFH